MPEQRNLILAVILSVGIIFAFQYFYEVPRLQQEQARQQQQQSQQAQPAPAAGTEGVVRPAPVTAGGVPVTTPQTIDTEAVLADSPRVTIKAPRVAGSIALQGGRIDDLTLVDYRETTDPTSPEIRLLSPVGSENPYFAEFGWVAAAGGGPVPDNNTIWQASSETLSVGSPVTLSWDNGAGLIFERLIEIDENYMFTVTQRVVNNGNEDATLYPYGLISRWGTPPTLGFFILHEGPIGVLQETLEEIDYSELQDDGEITFESNDGWLGITDKYWLTTLIPAQDDNFRGTFKYIPTSGDDGRYQVDFLRSGVVIPAGGTIAVVDHLFSGAKEVNLLDAYGEALGLPLFDRAVDFGWFYFLTKPFFHILHWLYVVFGNYGVAILILTLLVKLVFFPLANKSYAAMSQMKKLQPEMMKIRERYENDREKMNQEMMALYKREKVNPAAGCLPILIQIPVFFALYKVLFVSIEMRHAPFFGWITDLSAPDPTTLFNIFGLIPWTPPGFLPLLGIWPILMGLTMFLQMKLNPTPPDPIQARIMSFLPLIFVFLFATFPAGLVIYWTWNNVLSIGQQWLIMRKYNVAPG